MESTSVENSCATNAFAATAANFYSIKSPLWVQSESDGATRRDRGRGAIKRFSPDFSSRTTEEALAKIKVEAP
jgi:hypothetical protein